MNFTENVYVFYWGLCCNSKGKSLNMIVVNTIATFCLVKHLWPKICIHKTADGLKYYDLIEGNGPKVDKGSTVQVCISWATKDWNC